MPIESGNDPNGHNFSRGTRDGDSTRISALIYCLFQTAEAWGIETGASF
jgi:hypothetical protein